MLDISGPLGETVNSLSGSKDDTKGNVNPVLTGFKGEPFLESPLSLRTTLLAATWIPSRGILMLGNRQNRVICLCP